nr:immunoglobulin heavy chain junction region [Macaca mulatta]
SARDFSSWKGRAYW